MSFEIKAKQMITNDEDEEDLDELDPKEFKSEDSNEDEGDIYDILDEMGMLGNVAEDKVKENAQKEGKKMKDFDKQKSYDKGETAEDKLLIGSLYIALKQMRHAAKLN